MKPDDIMNLLKQFQWGILQRIYGSAHSSIIGFISTEWINLCKENSVLDGAPSPFIGGGRKGQKNADLLLCKGSCPYSVVEVESTISRYNEKIETILCYLNNPELFCGLRFGLMVMSNIVRKKKNNETRHVHNWDAIKRKVEKIEKPIALVSIKKTEMTDKPSPLVDLRRRNQYFPWNVGEILCWVFSEGNPIEEKLK